MIGGALSAIRENGATTGAGVLATFAYDDLGRRASLTRANGTVTSYGFDAASRLASLTQDMAGTANDLTRSFTYNPASQIVTTTSSNASYDWNPLAAFTDAYGANGLNQVTTVNGASLTYDAGGNLTNDGAKTYSYDASNRLTSATPNAGGAGVALAYDPAGRLFETVGTATTRFLYDGSDVIAEYSGTGALLRRYVHGPGIDEPLVQYDGSGTTSKKYLHADARGSIIALTDASGNVVAKNAYDPYGEPDAGNTGLFQYTGQIWLAEAGLYHYKARAYHPGLGRFLQTDPIGFGGGMNIYAYAGNDPVNATDPSGLCTGSRIGGDGLCSNGSYVSGTGYWYYGPAHGAGAHREDGGGYRANSAIGLYSGGGSCATNGLCPETSFIPGSSSAEDFGDEIVVTATRPFSHEVWPNGSSRFYSVGTPGALFVSSIGEIRIEIQNPALSELGIKNVSLTQSAFQHIVEEHSSDRRIGGTTKSTFNPTVLSDFTAIESFFFFLVPGFATAVPSPNTNGRPGYRLILSYGSFQIGINGRTGQPTSNVIVVIRPVGGPDYTIVTAFPD